MKNTSLIIAILFSILSLATCKKAPEVNISQFKIFNEKINPSSSSVTITGTFDYGGKINELKVKVGKRNDFTDGQTFIADVDMKDFSVVITELICNTEYKYRYEVNYGADEDYITETRTFTTSQASLPVVSTASVSSVGAYDAICGGNVSDDGGAVIVARGVCWSTNSEPTLEDRHTIDSCGLGQYESNITDLALNAKYYVRAYATNSTGTAYGSEKEFTTISVSPSVSTIEVTNITDNSAMVKANVSSDGGSIILERGFCWNTTGEPSLEDVHQSYGNGSGAFSGSITGLNSNTIYYVRSYAVNSIGVGYGEVLLFTTNAAIQLPIVSTIEISNITSTSVRCVGNVSAVGSSEVIEKGACWSLTPNPTTSDNHLAAGAGLGEYFVNIFGLVPNKTYYIRTYAKNQQGVGYGDEKTFTTTEGLPVVITGSISEITSNSAKCSGNVTDQGASAVTERGICWGVSHNPTTDNFHENNGQGMGEFSCILTSLAPNTTYYVRAYAKNSQGISYGSEISFTALEGLPVVITSEVTEITSNSAKCGGNVADQGGSTVSEKGICWSTNQNPTILDSHHASGSGTGTYTTIMNNLLAGTTYYVRAYAMNAQGTAYGESKQFVTLADKPTVITSNVTNITQTTATGGGNVTSDGGATVTERGVCWGISHNPTISNNHQASGNGIGNFAVSMTGLSPNTIYYIRAYAINSQGTSYGQEVQFSTNANQPTVTTNQVTNISQTTATGGGNVTSDGGAAVTERGICWSTSHNPTTNGNHANSGVGTGSYSVNMSGLTANRTYYVRAYAINAAGISYGNEVSFTTAQNNTTPTVTTSQVTNISQTTATGGGNVTSDGGTGVTQRGICWSTSHNPTTNNNHTTNGTGTGSFSSSITGLTSNTTYYVRAYATNSVGTAYGNEVSFTTLLPPPPTGAINGLFTISANGDKVYFSRGNLQYRASTNTWRFAEHQYDNIGSANENASQTYDGWIDLFGWGTSRYHNGADPYNVNYQPWSTSTSTVNEEFNRYGYGPSINMPSPNLTGSSANYDWGVYNPISNGGNQSGQWRTMSENEWVYVFLGRNTTSGIRFAKAQVNGIVGVILVPDNWNSSIYSLIDANNSASISSSNIISSSTWTNILEANGCVFLPAAGMRFGNLYTNISNAYAWYWTTTFNSSMYANCFEFYDGFLGIFNNVARCSAFSVRLVRDF